MARDTHEARANGARILNTYTTLITVIAIVWLGCVESTAAMVRITAELVRESPQFLNPLKQREIDLRSNKIPIVENLGATLDQFDAIDLSDNDITRLDGFPTLKRLKTLFINNNRIAKIAPNLHQFLPNLEELILTNNNIQEFADLDA